MARIRSIKPEFWTSAQVMECSTNARLLFIGLWNFCDDAGRMSLSPRRIKAQVFPSDDIVAEDVRRMIDELSANGLLSLYVADGKEFLAVTGWHHQKIDRPQKSQIPDPPEPNSPNGRRTIGVGGEGKGEDRKGESPGGGGASPAQAPAREAQTRHEAQAEPAQATVEPPADAAAPPLPWNSRENFDRVERRCREALPRDWCQDLVVSPMARLVADGADLEREVVPILLDLAASRRLPIRTWRVLAEAVAERIALQRTARVGEGLPAVPAAPPPPEETVELPGGTRWPESVLRQWITRFRDNPGSWNEFLFGPPPGTPGCKIPSRLLIGEAA